MNITFRQLQVFVEVARQNSVARASETLHLTSPAVSLQIKAIEREVGQVFFDRANRSMTLTAAGEFFLDHARQLLADLRSAEVAMEKFNSLDSGHLTIAMISSAKYFLPYLLAQFHELHPEIDLKLKLGTRDQIDDMLTDNEVDLCIMGRSPRQVPSVVKPFAPHPHVLVMSPDHRLANTGYIPVSELSNETFIVREKTSGTRAALEEFLAQHQINPPRAMEMASNEAIKQAVIANMGISLLSRHIISLELKNELMIVPEVEGLPIIRQWNVVHAASRRLSPAAEKFMEFILGNGLSFLSQKIETV